MILQGGVAREESCPVLMITFEAKEFVARTIARENHRPLRLEVHEGGGFELRPDSQRLDDLTFTHEGELLMLVDCELAIALDGKRLDADPSGDGAGLALRDRA
jgi:hypothetical protein